MIILNKRTSSKKLILISVIVIILIGLLCALYVYGFKGSIFGWSISNSNRLNPATTSPQETPTSTSTQSINISPATTKATNGSDQPQPSTTQPDGSKTVSINITSTNQTTQNYHLGVIIYSEQSSGTCTLTLSKQGSITISQTVDVQALPSSSTCKGFDIPTSELSSGDWQANVAFSNPPYSGSTTQSIKVN
jgi:hypothetical protein